MKKVLFTLLVFFAGASVWAQEFNSDGETLTITVTTVTNEASASKVKNELNSGKYSTVSTVVVNGGGTIDGQFVQNILYTEYSAHANIKTLDLHDINFSGAKIERGSFVPTEKEYRAGHSELNKLILPSNVTNIGKQAFYGFTKLETVVFPDNLDKIDDAAFRNVPVKNLKFNEALRFIGTSAFDMDGEHTETTITIPASVRYIGPSAFGFRQYQDVYFQGTIAPIMPLGVSSYNSKGKQTAFSAHTLMGNNGFNPAEGGLRDDAKNSGYANRENYNNGYYFCIMHYPSNTTKADAYDYTDLTRSYQTRPDDKQWTYANTPLEVGQEGDNPEFKDGWGEAKYIGRKVDYGYKDTYVEGQYIWPSQSQWNRSYVLNTYGYEWNGVDKYLSKLNDEDYQLLAEGGFVKRNEGGQYSEEELQKIAHLGTRQFVLVNADGKSTPRYKFEVTKGEWWTICVPFNMTKKQVLDAFGADTKLCLFTSVVRQIDINNKNHILLNFTQSALKSSTTDENGKKLQKTPGHWDYEAIASSEEPEDNDIVLWAHESYMIKPDGGAYSDKEPTYIMDSYEPVEGNPLPTIVIATTKTLGQADDFTAEYRFIGNYLGNAETRAASVKIPQYSYVYATTKSDPVCKFRFYTGTTSNWKPNKSIVQTNNRGGGAADYKNFFGGEPGILPAGAKQSSIFGDEDFGAVTGIDDVTIVVGSEALTPIFNLEGKMVRTNGNVEGLPKGVYVKAGKKFIIK